MKSMQNVTEVSALIRQGKKLVLAGDEALLAQLPTGNWIGGTIPYFMSEDGGVLTHDQIQVIELPPEVTEADVKFYSSRELEKIPTDYRNNGFSCIIIPAGTEAHSKFARDCSTWPSIFDRPLMGWISGVDLKDLGKVKPKVFNGKTGKSSDEDAVVLHLDLIPRKMASLNIINLFKQGPGDTITFPETEFTIGDCFVNGEKRNFADYLASKKINTQLPLVANYMGAMVNVSFQGVDAGTKKVSLYAPVFPGVEYKIAEPIGDYEKEFNKEIGAHDVKPAYTCNCILNYLYANLEGKKTANIVGPITFGEIAYMLLNQTMVYLTIDDKIKL